MLAVELQPLGLWKLCSSHAVERPPSKGTSVEEVVARLWGKKRQAAEAAAAEDGESSRKQAGVKEERERRMGWIEMEGMLSSVRRKTKGSVDKRGNRGKVTVNSCGSSSKQVQKPPDKHMQRARLEGQASPGSLLRAGTLTEGCGISF